KLEGPTPSAATRHIRSPDPWFRTGHRRRRRRFRVGWVPAFFGGIRRGANRSSTDPSPKALLTLPGRVLSAEPLVVQVAPPDALWTATNARRAAAWLTGGYGGAEVGSTPWGLASAGESEWVKRTHSTGFSVAIDGLGCRWRWSTSTTMIKAIIWRRLSLSMVRCRP